MFIEDAELRSLYRDASKDHLHKLEAGLLYLEKHPADSAKLKELLRAAHSLKGDSRMLGVKDAETLTHQMEDLLSSVEQGERVFTPTLCDCLYQGLDAVRKIAREAVTGDPAEVSVFHVLAQLMNVDDSPTQAPTLDASIDLSEFPAPLGEVEEPALAASIDLSEFPTSLDEIELSHDQTENTLVGEFPPIDNLHHFGNDQAHMSDPPIPTLPVQSDLEAATRVSSPVTDPETSATNTDGDVAYHIDTVRVESPKLDTLMTQAGELAVTKRRIARRLDDIDKVLTLWEEWTRDALVNRLSFDSLEQQLDPEALAPLQKFQQLNQGHLEQLGELLKHLHTNAYGDSTRLESLSNDLEAGILNLRQLPLSSMFSLFPRMVRDLAKQQGKNINLVIEGGDTQADKRILEEMKAPLTHLIRNAIDHGIESPSERLAAGKPPMATICLKAYQIGSRIGLEVIDDGRGLNLERIKQTAARRGLHTKTELAKMSAEQIQALIFSPGFSTRTSVTEISGRGVGLDVVRVNVERLKGSIQVQSTPTQGCTFRFTLNTSLATTFALILAVNQTPYAIPIEFVDRMMRVDQQDIFTLEGSSTITDHDRPLSVAWLTDLLNLPISVAAHPQNVHAGAKSTPCIVLKVGSERLGLLVDDLLDQQDIVLKPHSKLLKRVRNIAGATILGTGEVCMVLNPLDLLKSAGGKRADAKGADRAIATANTQPNVLLVEDSIPIRTQVRRILEGAGYSVTTAVDGLDGFDKLQEAMFDAVVSDVEMPNLDGLGLTTRIRQQTQYEELPIILVTTLAKDEDKRRGADAGANAYITKGDFDQNLLINTLRSLI